MNLKREVDKLSIEITRLGLGSNIEIDDKTGIIKVTTRDRQLKKNFSFKVVPAWHDDIVEYALNLIKKHYREMKKTQTGTHLCSIKKTVRRTLRILK